MDREAAQLVRYVPDLVLERFAAQRSAPGSPHCETLRVAMLFADVAGFTAMTERLAKEGPRGAERVASLLNGYFGRLLDAVMDAGGDVLKLAGDAALVVWPCAEPVPGAAGSGGLEVAVERAVATALHLQELLRPDGGEQENALLTRIAVCAGEISVMHVGGVLDRWELLVSGPAIEQIAVAHHARPGEVVLSAEAAALFSRPATRWPLDGGAVRVHGPSASPPPSSPSRRSAPPPEGFAALRSYLPGAVRARIEAGQLDWLAELRTVTVLFIKLVGATQAGAADLAAIHAQVRAIQAVLYRYEGSLNKLSVDEKGVTVLAAMGLPPFAHEDDALRAVRAARRIEEDLLVLGVHCAIGVAHGRVFSGIIGGAHRCEYTIIGDVVNLAARLMQATDEGVLCDGATFASARARFDFDALAPITVKGKAEPVAIFVPKGPSVAAATLRPMVGRRAELARVIERLCQARGGVLVVEGEAGSGKSRLLAESVVEARKAGVHPLQGRTDPTERGTAYHAWRPVFAALLELESSGSTALEKARALLGSDTQAELLPLLEVVLPVGLPDSALTAEMQGEVRADNTRKLLLDVLRAAAGRFRIAVLLEDAHWMDSASLRLAHACTRDLPNVPVILTTRVVRSEAPEPEIERLLADPATERTRLAPLERDEIGVIACRTLGASSLSEAVVDVLGERAQGNAFFCEELAKSLRDAGVVVVRDGEAGLADGVDVDAAGLPRSIDAVITSRVDRLPPDEQLTLKVASVIGRVFELRVLHEVHPSTDRLRLGRALADLEERELIAVESAGLEPTYAFRHALIVDAVYGLMLFAQRQQLHRAVAECVERLAVEGGTEAPHGLLAHHWSRAGDDGRALTCLERAGERALRSGAYAEAAAFLSDALAVAARTPAGGERLRTGRMARQLGEAQLGLGQMDVGVQTLEGALERLEGSPPWAGGVPARVGKALLTQIARRVLPGAFGVARGDDGTAHEAARAWRELFLSYIFSDAGKSAGATLIGMNRAEEAGPSSVLSHAYASAGLMARLVGLEGVARAYTARATRTALAIGDRTAAGYVRHCAGVGAIQRADWRTAREELAASFEHYDKLGDRRRWTEVVCQLSTMAHYQGNFEERLVMGAQVWARGKDGRDVQAQAWGLLDQAETLVRMGRLDQALALLDKAIAYEPLGLPPTDRLWAHGLLAVSCLLRGDAARARSEAEKTLELTRTVAPNAFYIMEGYAGATETFLALWEARREDADGAELRTKARAMLRQMMFLSLSVVAARPRRKLCAGLAAWLDGRPRAAHRAWRNALGDAERLGMPYEEARAHAEIGLHLPAGDPARRSHLERARVSFERVGAAWDLERLEAATATGAAAASARPGHRNGASAPP